MSCKLQKVKLVILKQPLFLMENHFHQSKYTKKHWYTNLWTTSLCTNWLINFFS